MTLAVDGVIICVQRALLGVSTVRLCVCACVRAHANSAIRCEIAEEALVDTALICVELLYNSMSGNLTMAQSLFEHKLSLTAQAYTAHHSVQVSIFAT